MAKITTPESLYGNSRDILREAERENEILADIAGEEYESPGDIPKGKYVIEKRLLDAAQKKNELLESIAEGGGGGGGGAAKAIGIDYATDVISLKDKDGETIAGSGATLPAYGVSFDPTTGGLTLTKNGTAVSGQTVTIPNYGSPVGVTSSSDMTDHDTIYLYEGTTSGSYTNGHFYYWDGSAWADGGEYAAATVQTDKTLLVEDRAADAKATGEAIGELKTQIGVVDNALLQTVNADWKSTTDHDAVNGWRTGYWVGNIGSAYTFSGSNAYMCINFAINAENYPELENADTLIFKPASGYCIRVFVADQNGVIIDKIGEINSSTYPDAVDKEIAVQYNAEYKYVLSMGRFADNSAAQKIADAEFCESIKFIIKKSNLDVIDNEIADINNKPALRDTTKPIIWKAGTDAANKYQPLGWQIGYYKNATGIFTISANYLATIAPQTFDNATEVQITPPSGYYINGYEWDSEDAYIGVIMSSGDSSEIDTPIKFTPVAGHKYQFTIGRFSGDSKNYITKDYIDTINTAVKVDSFVSLKEEIDDSSLKTYFEKTGEYEFFSVAVDRPLSFGGEEISATSDDIECVLRLPETYTVNGKPTRLVLACHGASGYISSANSVWYNANWKSFMDALLSAGYAVFDANVLALSAGTSPNIAGYAVGSPLYVNVLKKAYDYITENYNVTKKIFAHGTSMGGVGATAFTHAYPDLVLAESSFAGRDFLRYLKELSDNTTEERFALAYGYDSLAALNTDKFSHAEGAFPSLSIVKYVNGVAQIPPDRETAYSDWLAYYTQIVDLARDDDAGVWMAKRSVPYKAWNSWADSVPYTKLEEVLAKAYNTGNSCPYYTIEYETGTHTEMSYGQINNMIPQLIAWFKRWE